MKEFLSLILSLFIYFPVIAQTKTDCRYEQLTGKVKSVEAFRLTLNQRAEPTALPEKTPSYVCRYDTQGELTERISYDPTDGYIASKIVYNFDEKGRNIGYDEYDTIKKQLITIPRKHVYTLDERGLTIEYRVFEADGSPAGRFTYKYDSGGNKIEYASYYHTGRFGGKTDFTYDEDGRQISEISYDVEGNIARKVYTTYHRQENEVEKLQYQGETLRYKFITKFDDKKRIIEQETIGVNVLRGALSSHSPVPGKIISRYDDSDGTVFIERYSPDGNLVSSGVVRFDKHGNRIESRSSDSPAVNSIKYEYDSHNNWTKRISASGNRSDASTKFYYITERLITYYK